MSCRCMSDQTVNNTVSYISNMMTSKEKGSMASSRDSGE